MLTGFWQKIGVQWFFEHSTSYQILCWVDSLMLRNPLLRQAPNRYASCSGSDAYLNLTAKNRI